MYADVHHNNDHNQCVMVSSSSTDVIISLDVGDTSISIRLSLDEARQVAQGIMDARRYLTSHACVTL